MFSKKLLQSLSTVTLVNISILFFGFLREIVFSSKLGISNFSDNFFYYYLVVEDFNAIIYTGLMFGLVSFYTKEKLSNQDIKNYIFRNARYLALFLIVLFLLQFILISFFQNNSFNRLAFNSLLAIPFSIFNGLIMSFLVHNSKIALAIFSRAINYCGIILFFLFIDIRNDQNLIGLSILFGYSLQCLYLLIIIFFDKNKISEQNKIRTLILLKENYTWIIAPLLVPFCSNLIFRSIFIFQPDNLVSTINYASKIIMILSAFTFSVILVGFQESNIKKRSNKIHLINNDLKNNVRLLSIVLIPLSIFISIFSNEIMSLIFLRGSFTEADVLKSSHILSLLIFSTFSASLFGYLSRVYENIIGKRKYHLFFLVWLILSSTIIILFTGLDKSMIAYPVAQITSTSILSVLVFISLKKEFKKISYTEILLPITLNLILFIKTLINF